MSSQQKIHFFRLGLFSTNGVRMRFKSIKTKNMELNPLLMLVGLLLKPSYFVHLLLVE